MNYQAKSYCLHVPTLKSNFRQIIITVIIGNIFCENTEYSDKNFDHVKKQFDITKVIFYYHNRNIN